MSDRHQYYIDHRDEILAYQHQYHIEHKDYHKIKSREYYLNHKDHILKMTKQYRIINGRKESPQTVARNRITTQAWYDKNKDQINEKKRQNRYKLKLKIFNAYGGPICTCCGETTINFLCIDHMNGGGQEHRRTIGGGHWFYQWLEKNRYPTGYQVLCMNCNWGKRMNHGICPHKQIDIG